MSASAPASGGSAICKAAKDGDLAAVQRIARANPNCVNEGKHGVRAQGLGAGLSSI